MNSSGSGASGTGSTGSTSLFNGSALAEWGSGNSGNGGLNDGGAASLVLPTIGTQPSGMVRTVQLTLGGLVGVVVITHYHIIVSAMVWGVFTAVINFPIPFINIQKLITAQT